MTLSTKQLFVLRAIAKDEGNSISHYARKNESSYSYVNIIVHQLEDLKLVKVNQRVLGSILTLTKNGLKLHELYNKIAEVISNKAKGKK